MGSVEGLRPCRVRNPKETRSRANAGGASSRSARGTLSRGNLSLHTLSRKQSTKRPELKPIVLYARALVALGEVANAIGPGLASYAEVKFTAPAPPEPPALMTRRS